jgi:hypothetical protein
MKHAALCGLILLACTFIDTAAAAQQSAARLEQRAPILVLGTYHFGNPGLDARRIRSLSRIG